VDVAGAPALTRRLAADRANAHARRDAERERDRPQDLIRVGEPHGKHQLRAVDATEEARRVADAEIDRVRVDVVGARDVEAPLGIERDRAGHVSERAADVGMRIRLGDDQTRVVTAPGAQGHARGLARPARLAGRREQHERKEPARHPGSSMPPNSCRAESKD
jgi:hypothetical protein